MKLGLRCEGLCLHSADRAIFSGIGFSLLPGACMIVRGANGSGKTSFLEVMASLLMQSSGSIIYNGFNIHDAIDEYRHLSLLIGHEDALDLECTVIENIDFWAKLYDTEMAILAAATVLGIVDVLNTRVMRLSRGMRRRVALARLMLSPARLWLLDEPFAHLDNLASDVLCNMIGAKCSQGGIVILSTNQPTGLNTNLILQMESFKNG